MDSVSGKRRIGESNVLAYTQNFVFHSLVLAVASLPQAQAVFPDSRPWPSYQDSLACHLCVLQPTADPALSRLRRALAAPLINKEASAGLHWLSYRHPFDRGDNTLFRNTDRLSKIRPSYYLR